MQQLRQICILLLLCVHFLRLPRTGGVDRQVGILQSLSDSELISEHCHRIYAVTMRNTPITAGFVVIVAAQLALGIYLITFGVREKSKAKLRTWKICVSLRASVCFATVTHVQVNRSHRYLLMHIVCA